MKVSNNPSIAIFESLLGLQLEDERKDREQQNQTPPSGFLEQMPPKKRRVSGSLLRSFYKPNRPYKIRAIAKMADKDDDEEDPQKSILKRRLIEKLKSKI